MNLTDLFKHQTVFDWELISPADWAGDLVTSASVRLEIDHQHMWLGFNRQSMVMNHKTLGFNQENIGGLVGPETNTSNSLFRGIRSSSNTYQTKGVHYQKMRLKFGKELANDVCSAISGEGVH